VARILLPTDFSRASLNAVRYGIRLFGAEGNRFVLLNTYMMPRGGASTMWNMDEMLAREAQAGVSAFADAVRKEFPGEHLELEAVCEHGDLPNVVDRYLTDTEPPTCVVMGTQGASGLEEVLFGSNTAAVIKQGAFPVLAVPRDTAFREPQRIVLAHDGGPLNEPVLRPLLSIARKHGSEVRIARVVNEASPAEPGAQDKAMADLFADMRHSSQFVSSEDVEAALCELAIKADASMLVVLHRKRGIFTGLFKRSLSAALAMHTNLPLLVLQHGDR
jgi:nucleotide-binding universal stress UspA family protein